jgi:putative ABC transport system permease protein
MLGFIQDVRYAIRTLRKAPGFTFTAVLTLALGLGANAIIFSFVDSVWLRPMAMPQLSQVVRIFTSDVADQGRHIDSSYPDYVDLRSQARSLKGLAALERRGAFYDNGALNKLELANVVSENFFSVLEIHAALGRTFTAEEFRDPEARPVLISYEFWRRELNSNPAVVGHNIILDGTQAYVEGVLPRDFRGGEALSVPALWIPEPTWERFQSGEARRIKNRGSRDFELYGRLAPGHHLAQANAELALISERLGKQFPQTNAGHGLLAIPLSDTFDFGERIGPMLLALAAFVLMIACANLANLLLVRSEHRRREIAMRFALGARRGTIVRQLLTENAVLAGLACIAALVMGRALSSLIPAVVPQGAVPLSVSTDIDTRAVVFATACALACVFLSGLVPAMRSSRLRLAASVNRQASSGPKEHTPLRNLLVVGQVAISLVMVVAAGLLVRSIYRAYSADPGFNAHQEMLVADLAQLSAGQRREARARIERLPGVVSTTASYRVPFGLSYSGASRKVFLPSSESARKGVTVHYTAVADRYFETLGTRIMHGRAIDAGDIDRDAKVVVVNQQMASALWPGQDAVGQILRLNKGFSESTIPEPVEYRVIGIAENGKYNELNEPTMAYLFVPLTAKQEGEITISIRSASRAESLAAPVREILRSIDPGVLTLEFTTMREHIRQSMSDERLTARLVGAMGGLGLMLAALGLYGLMSFLVGHRTQEIGIRLALGALPQQVFRMILGRALWLVSIGVVVGCVASLFATRLLRSLLYGVRATDMASLIIAIAVLIAVAILAALLPAVRAMRLDPMEALRHE